MNPNIAYVFAIFAIVNVILSIISLATPDWYHENQFKVYTVGLWQFCGVGGCAEVIYAPDYIDAVQAVKAFLFMGIFAQVFATVSGVLVGMSKAKPLLISMGFGSGALCLLISMAVFTGEIPLNALLSYGYSYILGWVSCGWSLICAIASAVAAKQ